MVVLNLVTRGSLLNPPIYWQDFEDLCCDLWAKIWKDPDTQKYGRQVQSQHGVDICGKAGEETRNQNFLEYNVKQRII